MDATTGIGVLAGSVHFWQGLALAFALANVLVTWAAVKLGDRLEKRRELRQATTPPCRECEAKSRQAVAP